MFHFLFEVHRYWLRRDSLGSETEMAKDYKQIRLLALQALNTLEKLDELVELEEYGICLQDELDHLLGASPLDELV